MFRQELSALLDITAWIDDKELREEFEEALIAAAKRVEDRRNES